MDVLRFVPGGVRPPPLPTFAAPVSAAPAPSPHAAAAAASPAPGFHSPLLGLWPRRRGGGAENALGATAAAEAAAGVEEARDHRRRRRAVDAEDGRGGGGNWVLQILRVQSSSSSSSSAPSPSRDEGPDGSSSQRCVGRCGAGPDTDSEEGCSVADAEELDRAAFSRLLRKVSLAEAKLYSRMSRLCNFAYMVPRIKVTTNAIRTFPFVRFRGHFC